MYLIWTFHVKFSSRKTPKNFMDSDCLISLLHIFSFGRTDGILSYLLGLWKKNEYFIFVTFKNSLLGINYWLIVCNSMLTISNVFIFSSA